MKKIIVLISLFFLCMSSTAKAEHSSAGTVMGAAGGAIVGQAVSRNAEGTLIGAALGGVVGYLIGSEADRGAYPNHGYRDRYGRDHGVNVVRRPPPIKSWRPALPAPHYRERNVIVVPEKNYHGPKHRWDSRHDRLHHHDARHHR